MAAIDPQGELIIPQRDWVALGKRVKVLRMEQARGFRETCGDLGISLNTLHRLERGEGPISLPILRLVLNYVDCSKAEGHRLFDRMMGW